LFFCNHQAAFSVPPRRSAIFAISLANPFGNMRLSVASLEWPARGQGVLPSADLLIELALWQQGRRAILTPHTEQGHLLLQQLQTFLPVA
jgi:tRNA A37 threonylcarbamoyladenosine biosynthesis protein TsaE